MSGDDHPGAAIEKRIINRDKRLLQE